MGNIEVETTTVHEATYAYRRYQDESGLPDLLMLHGFMGTGRVFEHMVDGLMPACNPVAVDLLGHGQSEKAYNPRRYEEQRQVEDLLHLARKLCHRTIFCYGYSMGGRLALKSALQKPSLFRGLILESTNPGIQHQEARNQRRRLDRERARQIARDYAGFLSDWEKADLFASPIEVEPALETKYRNIHLEQDPQAMAASIRGFSTGAMQPVTGTIGGRRVPALIIAGTADKKYMQIGRDLAGKRHNTTFVSIEAGHRVHCANPGKLIPEISSFIAQN